MKIKNHIMVEIAIHDSEHCDMLECIYCGSDWQICRLFNEPIEYDGEEPDWICEFRRCASCTATFPAIFEVKVTGSIEV